MEQSPHSSQPVAMLHSGIHEREKADYASLPSTLCQI